MSDFLGIVQAMQLAIKAMLMYTESHPRAQSALASLAGQVDRWLEDKPSLHIAASQGKLFLDGAPFEGTHVHLGALAKQLSERQISGFILQRGVSVEELTAVLDVLILKPAKIEAAGGAAAILAKKALPHVQLSQTQYKEVREGEGGEEDHGGPGARGLGAAESDAVSEAAVAAMTALAAAAAAKLGGDGGQGQPAPLLPPSPAFNLELLTEQWEDQLDLLAQPSLLEPGGFSAASLGYLGGSPLSTGMGDGYPPAHHMEALRKALTHLPPETLLAVVAGLDSLPASPKGMRLGFHALAGQAFSQAAAGLIQSEAPWEHVKDAIFGTLRYAPQQQSMLAALEAELRNRGLGMEIMDRFQELIQQLDWESLGLEEKLRLAMQHNQLWSLTLDQRLVFLRRLLEEGRSEAFLALLEQILEALAGEEPTRREAAAQTLSGICRWMTSPGLPIEAEGPLLQGLTAHFGWEPHLHIHRATAEALDLALGSLINRGEPGHALGVLRDLAGLCEFQASDNEWRDAALRGLWARLADPASLRKVIELLHTANPETMLTELIPYLEAAGDAASRLLVDVLGEEPDRKRRARLLEAIRGLGEPALPAVYEGLESPTWYLVRNTLNLLADMGDAGALPAVERCLGHVDGRVKRAAVRTLWKVGGPAAVPALLATFPGVDPETQQEIIFAVGQVRAILAVPVLASFALDKHNPEALRTRAAETLGQIGEPKAIPALTELALRKGRFFTTAEATPIRLAACRALVALGTQSALEALRTIIAAEPENKERALLHQVLVQGQAD